MIMSVFMTGEVIFSFTFITVQRSSYVIVFCYFCYVLYLICLVLNIHVLVSKLPALSLRKISLTSHFLIYPQRKSRKSRPVARWRLNKKYLQILRTRGSYILGLFSTDRPLCITCHSWQRLWHMVLTYMLQVRRRRGKRHLYRLWLG